MAPAKEGDLLPHSLSHRPTTASSTQNRGPSSHVLTSPSLPPQCPHPLKPLAPQPIIPRHSPPQLPGPTQHRRPQSPTAQPPPKPRRLPPQPSSLAPTAQARSSQSVGIIAFAPERARGRPLCTPLLHFRPQTAHKHRNPLANSPGAHLPGPSPFLCQSRVPGPGPQVLSLQSSRSNGKSCAGVRHPEPTTRGPRLQGLVHPGSAPCGVTRCSCNPVRNEDTAATGCIWRGPSGSWGWGREAEARHGPYLGRRRPKHPPPSSRGKKRRAGPGRHRPTDHQGPAPCAQKDTVSKQRQDDEIKGREHAFADSTLRLDPVVHHRVPVLPGQDLQREGSTGHTRSAACAHTHPRAHRSLDDSASGGQGSPGASRKTPGRTWLLGWVRPYEMSMLWVAAKNGKGAPAGQEAET